MKRMSGKVGTLLLVAVLSVSFIGCGNTEGTMKEENEMKDKSVASETTSAEAEEDNREQTPEMDADDSGEQPVGTDWGSLAFYGETVTVPCTLADLEAMDIHLYNEDEKEEMLSTPNGEFFMLALTYGDEDIPLTAYFETGDDVSKKEENVILTAVNSGQARKEYLTYKGFGYGDSVDDFVASFGDDFDCIIGLGGDDIHSGSVRFVGGDNNVIVRIAFVDGELHTVEIEACE